MGQCDLRGGQIQCTPCRTRCCQLLGRGDSGRGKQGLGRGLSVITELQAHSELEEPASPLSVDGLLRFAAGAMLGLALVAGTAGPARADVEASAGWPHSWSLISEAI